MNEPLTWPRDRACPPTSNAEHSHPHTCETEPDCAACELDYWIGEAKRLKGLVYVPGLWRCPKCQFNLMRTTLNVTTGTASADDTSGEKCPNCQSPLWRVTERDAGNELVRRLEVLAVPPTAWQPIETAPRDGTPVLVSNAERGGAWIAYYCEVYQSGYRPEDPWHSLMLNMRWHNTRWATTVPTHWMPIPAPVRPETKPVSQCQMDGCTETRTIGGRHCIAHEPSAAAKCLNCGHDQFITEPRMSIPVPPRDVIALTPAEVQSNYNRVQWAEGLIRQLPETHEGRNSWLLNYGTSTTRQQNFNATPAPCAHTVASGEERQSVDIRSAGPEAQSSERRGSSE